MNKFREQFPLLERVINGSPLVYFDNAATTPKPKAVISAVTHHYEENAGNPGRSTHTLAQESSLLIDAARVKFLSFIQAPDTYVTIFTKSATESINIVANALEFSNKDNKKKPTIIITEAEHHANFLPWLRLHKIYKFPLVIVPVTQSGDINMPELATAIAKHPGAFLAVTHCSNVTGTLTNMKDVMRLAKKHKTTVLLDASQSIPHVTIDLELLAVDYLVASAHKIYGPEGVGMLVTTKEHAGNLEPLLVGGGMVEKAGNTDYEWKTTEARLEAGTPNTSGIAGLSASIDLLHTLSISEIQQKEKTLHAYFLSKMGKVQGITWLSDLANEQHIPLYSFYSKTVHAHDIADFLDSKGIEVRAGHHCAQPLHAALGITASVRVSLAFYNSTQEIDYFFEQLVLCLQKFA